MPTRPSMFWILLAPAALAAAPPPVIDGAPSAHPSVVALGATDGAGFLLSCSGVLIRPDWVLGAAHCVEEIEAVAGALTPEARFGPDSRAPDERIEIDDMARHPEWRDGAFGYDVALFHLAEPASAPPTPLVDDALARDWDDEPLTWVGYGDTDESGSNDGAQRMLDVAVISSDETFLRTRGSGSANLCYGDSGGPALWTGDGVEQVVAVAAFVYQDDESGGCEGGGTAGLRVRIFEPWLNARLNGDVLLGGAPLDAAPSACAGGRAGAVMVAFAGLWGLPRRRRCPPPGRRATLHP